MEAIVGSACGRSFTARHRLVAGSLHAKEVVLIETEVNIGMDICQVRPYAGRSAQTNRRQSYLAFAVAVTIALTRIKGKELRRLAIVSNILKSTGDHQGR